MKTSKPNLAKIIFFDLISVGKVPLVLLICI
ncbi:cell division protein FtsL, partial [Vibrio sp. 10N.222.54.A1]